MRKNGTFSFAIYTPFNEPDFSATGQGTVTDFYNIAGELRKNPHFDSIRISGGNTLNTDQALPWYNQLKSRLDEGNTHQLAGSFDNYATFFQTVRANGHHATNDELHNVMGAMVGVEYGMQSGIWWGTAERTRSEFVKASDGRRLAYTEHRPNWTAAAVEFEAPDAPTGLQAEAYAESIGLQWQVSTAPDVAGYTIYRSANAGGPWETIAREVSTTAFVDNTATMGGQYFYQIRAVDRSLNHSEPSNEVLATNSNEQALVVHLSFDETIRDSSINLNHSAAYGSITYVDGKVDTRAISLKGTSSFLQLPASLTNHEEITIATWVFWRGGGNWQRIFDFGNNQDEYLFLTPKSGSDKLRFALKKGGTEQTLSAPALPARHWTHVAVSLSESKACLYVNGTLADESETISIRPSDFSPVHNYIGRSQYPDPLFNGYIDDFRI